MKPTIQSVRFTADKKLILFIEERVSKLENLFEGIIDVEVILKLEKSVDNSNKIAEIKLQIKGGELFAKKQCPTFEEAVDTVIDAIKTQLKKQKDKKNQAKF